MLISQAIFPLLNLLPSYKTISFKKKKDSSIIFALLVSQISRLGGGRKLQQILTTSQVPPCVSLHGFLIPILGVVQSANALPSIKL